MDQSRANMPRNHLLRQPEQRISASLEWDKQLEVEMPAADRGWRRLDPLWVWGSKLQIKRDKRNRQQEWDKTHNKQMRREKSRIEQQDKAQECPTQVANHWNQQEQLQPRKENHLTRLNPRRGRASLPICANSTSRARSSRRRSPRSTPRKKINPYRSKKATQ